MKKWMYELMYRFPFISIDTIFGPTANLEKMMAAAIDGRIPPGRANSLGCGVGRGSIHLAKKGFDVIGVDFSPTGIKQSRRGQFVPMLRLVEEHNIC